MIKQLPLPSKRRTWAPTVFRRVMLCLALSTATSAAAHGQGDVIMTDDGSGHMTFNLDLSKMTGPFAQQLQQQVQAMMAQQQNNAQAMGDRGSIVLRPLVITVDTSKIGTFRLSNATADSIPVDVVVQYTVPQPRQATASNAPTTPKANAPQAGVADNPWSLVGWVQDIPKGVILAPHETRTVALHVTAPSDAAPGTYSAYVIVYDRAPVKSGSSGNSYVMGKLVYTTPAKP